MGGREYAAVRDVPMMQRVTPACFDKTSNRVHLQVPLRICATVSEPGRPDCLWGSWQFGAAIALQFGAQPEQSRSVAKHVPRTAGCSRPIKSLCGGQNISAGREESPVDDETREFFQLLRDCYFHPSRFETFPYPELWRHAMGAVILLWYETRVDLLGVSYSREQIRDMLLKRMTPDQVDTAAELFVDLNESRSLRHLEMLILCVGVYGDRFAEKLYDHDQRMLAIGS